MLNLRTEFQGIREARDGNQLRLLLADSIVGEISPATFDSETTQRLFDTAIEQGVLGLFRLSHPGFDRAVLAARARSIRALKFTRRVVDAIESADIPVVVLKGSGAAARWSDTTLRQQSDVDVLVEFARKDDATRALIAAGICRERFLDSHDMHNDSLLPADPAGLMVEVHHYFNNHHDTRVDVGTLLARRTTVQTAQGDLPVLTREDDAVYLALHATTHALARLAWLVDLASLQPDWNEAAERAHAWNASLAVAPAWERTRAFLRTPIPDEAFARLQLSRTHWGLARAVLAAADASRGELHRFFERGFRLSTVPLLSMPGVLRQMLSARREEHDAYEKKEAGDSASPTSG